MKKKSGFTIVEVALVLGIAGLIMVMAFVALPSLWSSQRDADRRANVMNLISALKTYQTNNSRGALPTAENTTCKLDTSVSCSPTSPSWTDFLGNYYTKNHRLEDPGGVLYKVRVISSCGASIGNVCKTSIANDSFNSTQAGTQNFDIGEPVIYVVIGGTCDEDKNAIVGTANTRSVAAVQVLEKGKYCHST